MYARVKPLSPRAQSWVAGAALLGALAYLLAIHSQSLWLVGALAVGALVVWRPLMGLLALPVMVAFGSLSSFKLSGLNVGPTDVLVGALALAALTRLVRHRTALLAGRADWRSRAVEFWRARRFHCVVAISLLVYLAVVCLSALVAAQRTATAKEALKWSEVLVIAACTVWLASTLRQVSALVWAMIAAGALAALVGLGQWAADGGDLATGGQIRVVGTFAQPNPFAAYMNLALPLALALALFARDRRERWVAGSASVILFAAEYLAHSRGALLGLVGALVVIAALGWRRERQAIIAACVAIPVVALVWVAGLIPARLTTAVTNQFHVAGTTVCGQVDARDFSTVERIAHWVAGLRMFAAHPILGVGAGNYGAAYPRFACADWPIPLGHAHNYYINTAAELGVIGLAAFLALVGCALALGWRAARRGSNDDGAKNVLPSFGAAPRALAIGLLAVLVAVTIHNLTDDLFVHAMELQMAICAGCLIRLDGLLARDA
ncbi:MAG TPA: O-antigen ligase family protein [Ktedonobacterales bacterium]|nr:O-antigen ligase family protein [Ktedonobacterales bacterium]